MNGSDEMGYDHLFPHFPAIVHITLSAVKLCLSFNDDDCYHALWNETIFQSCNKFCTSRSVWGLLKINFHDFSAF